MGERLDEMDVAGMKKIAFCFPGQGSYEAGMGRDIAEAVPAAMDVYRRGSEACGSRPRAPLLPRRARGAARHRRAAAGARGDVARGARGAAGARREGRLRDRPLRRRVRGSRRRRGDVGRGRDRARPRAWPRDGGGRREEPRLDGRDPRSCRREGRSALPPHPRRVAGELQLPRPDRRLRREPRRRRVHRAGAERGRAPRGEAQGLGRVPFPARRPRRRPAAAGDREGQVPGADRAVHVDRDRARRVGAADRPAPRRPAHRAGPLHAVGDRAHASRRQDVRRGRPRQCPLRAS